MFFSFRFSRSVLSVVLAVSLCAVAAAKKPAPKATAMASDAIAADRMAQYADLAEQWEREYLQINTTNPPGNESRAAEFFKRIFDREGIENKVFEIAPGRANIWACLPRGGKAAPLRVSCAQDVAQAPAGKRPIILLSHEDVVTSEPSHWRTSPFSADIIEGSIYARGAQDMKSEGLAQLVVMVMLKREQVALDRNVIFMATADEEAGDTGSEWMIANQKPLFANAEFLITEGGENVNEDGKAKFIGVDVAEKAPFWLTVTATGNPGHGSRPIADSAPNHLVRSLNKIINWQTELKIIPVVDEFFKVMAAYEPPERARYFRDLKAGLEDAQFRTSLERDPATNYLLRNTVSLTMFKGSEQTNVIPGVATANIDVRLLPGEDPQQFLTEIRQVGEEPNVTIEPQSGFRLANSSSTSTALYAAFKNVAAHYFPGAPVVPHMTSGYNENQLYRPLGISGYGFSPYTATAEESSTEHGNNERIRVEEVRRGFRVLYDVVSQVATASQSR